MALDAILDTRFFFSYFNPEDEKTRAWSKSAVSRATSGQLKLASSVVSLTEIYSAMGRIAGEDEAKTRILAIKSAGIPFLELGEMEASVAGRIALRHQRLPLADCITAGTSQVRARGTVMTDDPHFGEIEGVRPKWLR